MLPKSHVTACNNHAHEECKQVSPTTAKVQDQFLVDTYICVELFCRYENNSVVLCHTYIPFLALFFERNGMEILCLFCPGTSCSYGRFDLDLAAKLLKEFLKSLPKKIYLLLHSQ